MAKESIFKKIAANGLKVIEYAGMKFSVASTDSANVIEALELAWQYANTRPGTDDSTPRTDEAWRALVADDLVKLLPQDDGTKGFARTAKIAATEFGNARLALAIQGEGDSLEKMEALRSNAEFRTIVEAAAVKKSDAEPTKNA